MVSCFVEGGMFLILSTGTLSISTINNFRGESLPTICFTRKKKGMVCEFLG